MTQHKPRYSEFWDRINVEAFEEAIGFSPEDDRNGNDVGYCLWPENHANGDTTGKFGIHREKRVYNCWACGGGSLLSLTMELYGYDVDEATDWLYQFCEDDTRSDREFVDEFMASFEDVKKRIETLPFFNERVLDQHSAILPQWWLEERGITHQTCDAYSLRYNEKMRRPVPAKGKFSSEEDYHGPAILFPHYYQERLVGWQCRWLAEDRPEWVPKYTMTTDFPKDTTVYGYDLARQGNDGYPVIVVESVPSALFVISCGYPSVATFGSSINEPQLRLLRKFSTGVILAPDNDNAGVKFVNTATEYLKRYIRVWHLPPPEGEAGADIGDVQDLDEYLLQAKEYGVDL